MAISWTNFLNGDTLLSIRDKLNAFSTSVVTEVHTNTTNIATNTSNIATTTAVLSALDTRITTIEDKDTFDYNQATSITVTGDTYEDILQVLTPTRAVGKYKVTLSMLYTFDSTSDSAYFRFSLDGGTNWIEVRKEGKDITDKIPSTYTTMIDHTTEGIIDIRVEARKENLGDTLIVQAIDAMLERKV